MSSIVISTRKNGAQHWQAFYRLLLLCGFLIVSGCATNSSNNGMEICEDSVSVEHTSAATLFYYCGLSKPSAATTLTSGYGASHTVLNWMARKMAAEGFVVLAMTPLDKYGMNAGWRDAHLAGIAEFTQLNAESGPLKGKIDLNKLQVCGQSKGGGGALWASSLLGSKIESTIALAPWHEQFEKLHGIQSATLFQTAENDKYVTRDMAIKEFDMLPSAVDKAYFEYESAHHFSWGILNLGTHHEVLMADILAWMKLYLNGDRSQEFKLKQHEGKTFYRWDERHTSQF